ncbi:M56 family metallopeptidase [Lacinutrix salivirga]
MLYSIFQIIAFQLFFIIVYDVFLKKETFFNYNRLYLIITSFLAFALPFIKIELLKTTIPKEYFVKLPELFNGKASEHTTNTSLLHLPEITISEQTTIPLEFIFYIGSGIALTLFLIKLLQLIKLIYSNKKVKQNGYYLIELLNTNTAFSFFKYIFLGNKIKQEDKASIIAHESIHIQQKHTLDLLYFEVLRILFWFNPLVYMYQKRIATLHEYIADAKVAKQYDRQTYYQNLLTQVFAVKQFSFINPFYKQSSIKKRIIMLSKSKSKQINVLKYALLIPMVVGMLIYTSCSNQEEIIEKELSVSEQIQLFKQSIEGKELTAQERKELMLLVLGTKKDSLEIMYAIDNFKSVDPEAVSFATIEKVPIYPGCSISDSNEDNKICFSKSISNYVSSNFNTKLAKSLDLAKGVQKINIFFTINKEGKIEKIKTRSPHPDLDAEAVRLVKGLPKMTPGEQGGKPVSVTFFLPIKFKTD